MAMIMTMKCRRTLFACPQRRHYKTLVCTVCGILKHALKQCIRPVVIILLLSILVTVYVCRDLPYSSVFRTFHHDEKVLDKEVNALNRQRLQKATQYFASLNNSSSTKFYTQVEGHPDLVISIVTVKRSSIYKDMLGYLTQTVASVDRTVKANQAALPTKVFLCNTDINGVAHSEAVKMSSYVPMVTKYDNELDKTKVKQLNIRQKETMDYIYCLEKAKSVGSKYIIMVEDDSLPNDNFIQIIKYALHQIGESEFAYMKLFYPLKWLGYAYEITRVLELVSFGALGGGLFVVVCWASSDRRHSMTSQNVQFCIGAIYAVIIVLLVGRPNVLKLRTLSPHLYSIRPSSACCTPAMLYPREIVPRLISFLNSSKQLDSHVNLDLQIYAFSEQHRIPTYQMEPNVFRHIGIISSLSSMVKKAEEFL